MQNIGFLRVQHRRYVVTMVAVAGPSPLRGARAELAREGLGICTPAFWSQKIRQMEFSVRNANLESLILENFLLFGP
jgi:hypothetical protein